jgi:hypothetical protein
LQHLEDLSDRELERYLSENVAAKWFCGFGLSDATPDHTVFTAVRRVHLFACATCLLLAILSMTWYMSTGSEYILRFYVNLQNIPALH